MIIRTLTAIVASTALLTACATHEVDYQGEGEGFVGEGSAVQARLETPSVGTAGQDAADDPAIWASATPVRIGGVSASSPAPTRRPASTSTASTGRSCSFCRKACSTMST